MLSQDSPWYPCVIHSKAIFRGTLLRAALETAVQHMLQLHPLLQARITSGSGATRWHFSPATINPATINPATSCPVTWSNGPPADEWTEDRFVDLRKESGLRLHIHSYLDTAHQPFCCMIMSVHHACADGLGLLDAFEDLCLLYQAIVTNQPAELRHRDTSQLAERNRFGLKTREIIRLLPKHAVGLRGLRQFLMRKPVPVLPDQRTASEPVDNCAVTAVSHKFSSQTTGSIQAMATRLGVTLNDLLACSIFQGLAQFRDSLNGQQPNDWLRMMVPVNMRSKASDSRHSACNIVSSVFLDRTPEQIQHADALLQSIHHEMELIKRNRLALIFSYSIWLRSKLHRGRPKPTSTRKCPTTLVFTNLGKTFRESKALNADGQITAGNVTLESIEILAPLAPLVGVAFSAIHYAKCLVLSLRYDQRVLDRLAAEKLLAAVCSRLETWLDREPIQA